MNKKETKPSSHSKLIEDQRALAKQPEMKYYPVRWQGALGLPTLWDTLPWRAAITAALDE